MTTPDPDCLFCKIIAGTIPAQMVHRDQETIAFLDVHPLFPGHILLCPVEHYSTLLDAPAHLTGPLMAKTQLLAKALETALDAEGSFIAINNTISQTVPHLHIHVVPRRKKDGLRGFFWPRQNYRDDASREAVRDAIEREVNKLLAQS